MLADFGIALAVSEAGGNRLTETGLSLGTPAVHEPRAGHRRPAARCPERRLLARRRAVRDARRRAAGDRAERPGDDREAHDRAAGPPPGGAALGPEAVDAAVAKALDKTPADRFASAGEFARALEARAATGSSTAPTVAVPAPRSRRMLWIGLAAALVALVSAGAWLSTRGRAAPAAPPPPASYALRDRSQLTFTGTVFVSAVSGDGKQLAYITHNCGADGCSYAVELQDVGGTATHRVLDGATAGYGLEWSPDRRNLIFVGTINRRWGFYLLSALGGPPQYSSPSAAMFWAGGDSLLIGPRSASSDSVLPGARYRDRRHGARQRPRARPRARLTGLSVSPGGRWIVALVIQGSRGLWQVLDRNGTVADRVVNSCTCPGRITHDALWLSRAGCRRRIHRAHRARPRHRQAGRAAGHAALRQLQQLQRHRRRRDAGDRRRRARLQPLDHRPGRGAQGEVPRRPAALHHVHAGERRHVPRRVAGPPLPPRAQRRAPLLSAAVCRRQRGYPQHPRRRRRHRLGRCRRRCGSPGGCPAVLGSASWTCVPVP